MTSGDGKYGNPSVFNKRWTMETIAVRTLGPEEYPAWDNLVEASPYGTIFHTSPWLVSVGRDAGVTTDFFGAFDGDHLVGGCAVHSRPYGGFFTSATTNLPLTSYGGVLIEFEDTISVRKKESDELLVINALLPAIERAHPHLISLTMSPLLPDIRPYIWQGWNASVNYCYIVSISGNFEERLSKSVRKALSKSRKEGIVARQKWDNDSFWELTLNTFRRQGLVPPYSRDMLFSLIDTVRRNNRGVMWFAETATGDVASGEIIIWDKKMAYSWTAVSDPQYMNTGAPTFLTCETMKHAQEQGFEHLNLMAANTPNLAQYVSGFNPRLVPYYTVTTSGRLFRMLRGLRSTVT